MLAASAFALLAWGALPYLTGQIDDTYIVFAYAHNIVDRHEVVWNTGARVEGYSSPLHLALMTLGALAGLDLPVFARAFSFVCAALVVLRLQRTGCTNDRYLLAALFAAWQPFEHWSIAGLETALATLLGVLAWPLVVGNREQWSRGVLLLAVLAVTRPEGVGWLGVALVRRLTLPREFGRPERLAIGATASLVAYHLARWSYFGYFLATPYLVKISAVQEYGDGARQLLRELGSAGGLLAATLLFRKRVSPWAWAPLTIQSALLVRAGGDWMGHARFLLPGLAATLAAAWSQGIPRGPGVASTVVVLALGAIGFAWEPSAGAGGPNRIPIGRWRDPWTLRHPSSALQTPWGVPLLEETSFLVERVPFGAGAGISDVGLPGNLEDIRIWDGAGLTDRATAEVIASPSKAIVQEILDRYHDDDDIWCLRYSRGPNGKETADSWLTDILPELEPSRSGVADMAWRCRPGGRPTPELVSQRWGRLVARFPSQDWIRWYYARSLVAAGAIDQVAEVVGDAFWLADDGVGWIAFGDAQGSDYQPGRGWALYGNGSRRSIVAPVAFWSGLDASVDVDDPASDGAFVRVRWEPECGVPSEAFVHERANVPPPECTSDAPRSLVVDFLNDDAHSGFDRNIYVSLAAR